MYSFTSNDTVQNRVKMKVKPFLMNAREEFHLTKLPRVSGCGLGVDSVWTFGVDYPHFSMDYPYFSVDYPHFSMDYPHFWSGRSAPQCGLSPPEYRLSIPR